MDKKDLSGQFQVTLQFRINRDEMLRNATTYNVRSWPFLWQLYVTLRRVEEGKEEVWIDRLEIQTIKNQLHLSSSSSHKKKKIAIEKKMRPCDIWPLFSATKADLFVSGKKVFSLFGAWRKKSNWGLHSDQMLKNQGIWRVGKPLLGSNLILNGIQN